MAVSDSPYQVWARALWAVLDLAALAGVKQDGVFEGLPFDATSVRLMRTVNWSDFCLTCERLEAQFESPEECQRLFADCYHQVLPEFRTLIGGLMSPLTFARMTIEGVSPFVYQGCSFSLRSLSPDRIRVELRLRAGARPSLTFFRATVGELRALPRHLGLAPAEVSAEFGPTHGNYIVTLPPSRSLTDRARAKTRDCVVRLVLGIAEDGEPMTLSFGGPAVGNTEAESVGASASGARLDAATRAWQLTPKQREVLKAVIEGASNKEIASDLGCAENTVESHVTKLLRQARVSSRGRLLAHFWSRL